MAKWNGNRGKGPEDLPQAATNSTPKPGNYPLGSVESRAAAQAMIEGKGKQKKILRVSFVEPGSMDVTSHIDYEIEDPD